MKVPKKPIEIFVASYLLNCKCDANEPVKLIFVTVSIKGCEVHHQDVFTIRFQSSNFNLKCGKYPPKNDTNRKKVISI